MYKAFLCFLPLAVLGRSTQEHLEHPSNNEQYSPNTKIVHGTNAAEGEFPYQVSIRRTGRLRGHFCGGSIISEKVVLTAAHCVYRQSPFTHLEVAAGMHLINKFGPNVQKAGVEKSIIHPKYPGGVNPYDIALLILEKPFKLNKFVQPVALPKEGEEFTGDAVISGWGSISDKLYSKMPEVLQKATVPLIDFESCEAKFEKSPVDNVSNICTGPIDGDVSACSGDSGGPLTQNVNGVDTVIGVVSWGMMPCGRGYPSVFTKVSSFIDFINENSV